MKIKLLLIASLLAFKSHNAVATKNNINILQISNSPSLFSTMKGLTDTLKAKGDYNVKFNNTNGDLFTASQLAKKYTNETPLCLVAIAAEAAVVLKSYNSKNGIPLFFSSISHPSRANLLDKNIYGVSSATNIQDQLNFFLRVIPKIKKFGIIYNSLDSDSIGTLVELKRLTSSMNIKLVNAIGSDTVEISHATTKLVNEKVDAIYAFNDAQTLNSFRIIVKKANKAKIPIFVSDWKMLEEGAFASFGPDQYEIGVQTAQMIINFLNGKNLNNKEVEIAYSIVKGINTRTARKLNISLSDEILQQFNKIID
jgi:putative tryptophan/tyrosine transport system substrate-binding protein